MSSSGGQLRCSYGLLGEELGVSWAVSWRHLDRCWRQLGNGWANGCWAGLDGARQLVRNWAVTGGNLRQGAARKPPALANARVTDSRGRRRTSGYVHGRARTVADSQGQCPRSNLRGGLAHRHALDVGRAAISNVWAMLTGCR